MENEINISSSLNQRNLRKISNNNITTIKLVNSINENSRINTSLNRKEKEIDVEQKNKLILLEKRV